MAPKSLDFTTPPDEPVIRYRRFFKAPRVLVFDVWTNPGHLRHWWGPRVLMLITCEVDLRTGGTYRFVLRAPDGQEFSLLGTYREIDPPKRLVSTFVLDVSPEIEVLETVTFDEDPNGTVVRSSSHFPSFAVRDQQGAGGMMEAGITDQFQRLDELLDSPQTA